MTIKWSLYILQVGLPFPCRCQLPLYPLVGRTPQRERVKDKHTAKPKHPSKYERLRAEVERLKQQSLQDAMCEFAAYFYDDNQLYEMVYRSALERMATLAGENLAEHIEKRVQAHIPEFNMADSMRKHALNYAMVNANPLVHAADKDAIIVTIDFGRIPSASVMISPSFQLGKRD